VETNIVLFDCHRQFPAVNFLANSLNSGLILGRGSNGFRAVTHRMVNAADIDFALNQINIVL